MTKRLLIALLLVWGILLQAHAQTNVITTSGQEGFDLYRCEASDTSFGVTLSAYLADKDGNSPLGDIDTISIDAVGYENSAQPTLEATNSARRNPIRMIVVLDTTSTMPLKSVVSVFSQKFAPQLEFSDEVALITFTKDVEPITAFYTDKNRLINEKMLDLQTLGGQNRVYNAVLEAVKQYPAPESTRNTVLLITDSGRRDVEQATINDVISLSNEKQVPIFSIGLYTQDRPDDSDLISLAESTNGFAWIYNNVDDPDSETALEQSLTTIFNQLISTLNNEVRLTVNLSGLDLSDADDITLKATVTLTNGAIISDNITCPIPNPTILAPISTAIPNKINFTNGTDPITTAQPISVGVTVETALPPEEQLIVFLQNGEIVQSSSNLVYDFNTPTLPPGIYNITAQLRNLDNSVFATTESAIIINAQQTLELSVVEGALDNFDAPMRVVALSNPTIALPDVRFFVRRLSDNTTYPFGGGNATVQSGQAEIRIPNVRDELLRIFPNLSDGEVLELKASIPAISQNGSLLADSTPLTITYKLPPPPPIDYNLVAVVLLSVALFLLNIILFRRVGHARVRRMIFRPDYYDLPNRLMAVTVYRDNFKQTHSLTKKTLTLGRGTSNDINLGDDNKISRQHGVIMWRKQDWYYTNRKGNSFVRINGKKISGFRLTLLEPVTEIEIGDARVFFHSNSQQDISELTKTNL